MKDYFGCPVKATSNVMAGKWKVLIVWHLSFGSRRFAEIRDLLPGVSEKVLTSQLRELEHDGVIRRSRYKKCAPAGGLHVERGWGRPDPCDGSDVRLEHEIPGRHPNPPTPRPKTGLGQHRERLVLAHRRRHSRCRLTTGHLLRQDQLARLDANLRQMHREPSCPGHRRQPADRNRQRRAQPI